MQNRYSIHNLAYFVIIHTQPSVKYTKSLNTKYAKCIFHNTSSFAQPVIENHFGIYGSLCPFGPDGKGGLIVYHDTFCDTASNDQHLI